MKRKYIKRSLKKLISTNPLTVREFFYKGCDTAQDNREWWEDDTLVM